MNPELKDIDNVLLQDYAFFRCLATDSIIDEDAKEVIKTFSQTILDLLKTSTDNVNAQVSIIGNFSSGKSSFVNSLFDDDVCPASGEPTTSSITKFVYGKNEKFFSIEGKTKKEISKEEYKNSSKHQLQTMKETKQVHLECHYPICELNGMTLHDTPGFANPKNQSDERLTIEHAKKSDIIVLLVDANNGSIDDTLNKNIEDIKKDNPTASWMVVLNKADQKTCQSNEKIKDEIKRKGFDEVFIYSSKPQEKKAEPLDKLFDEIKKVFDENLQNAEFAINIDFKKESLKFSDKYSFSLNGGSDKNDLSIAKINENGTINCISSKEEIFKAVSEMVLKFNVQKQENFSKKLQMKYVEERNLLKEFKVYLEELKSEYMFEMPPLSQELFDKLFEGFVKSVLNQAVDSDFEIIEKGFFSDDTFCFYRINIEKLFGLLKNFNNEIAKSINLEQDEIFLEHLKSHQEGFAYWIAGESEVGYSGNPDRNECRKHKDSYVNDMRVFLQNNKKFLQDSVEEAFDAYKIGVSRWNNSYIENIDSLILKVDKKIELIAKRINNA